MKNRISQLAVGFATSALFMVTFTLCVIFDLLFPSLAMYKSWQVFLPGFEWISFNSYLLGLVETFIYGWYVVLVWVPVYNYFIVGRKNKNHHKINNNLPVH